MKNFEDLRLIPRPGCRQHAGHFMRLNRFQDDVADRAQLGPVCKGIWREAALLERRELPHRENRDR